MKRKYLYIGYAVSALALFPSTGLQAQEETADSLVNVAFGTMNREENDEPGRCDTCHCYLQYVRIAEKSKQFQQFGWSGQLHRRLYRQRMGTGSLGFGGRCAP